MINFKLITPFFSQNILIKLTGQKLILPFYHTISEQRLPHISNLYQIRSTKQFEKDLDYLCKYFKPISIQELDNIVCNNKVISKPSFHLTFDDGLKEIYTEIAPILERKGIPATFFINTDFVDNKSLFYRYKVSLIIERMITHEGSRINLLKYFNHGELTLNEIKNRLLSFDFNDTPVIDSIADLIELDFSDYLKIHQPYLIKKQLIELLDKGFSLGSHSLNHPNFKVIDINEKKRQINESFKYLEKELNIKEFYFSFPFSDESVDIEFMDWLYNKANCKLSFGISGIKYDYSKYHIHRIPLEQEAIKVADIIKSEYLYFIVKYFFNKNRIKRQ